MSQPCIIEFPSASATTSRSPQRVSLVCVDAGGVLTVCDARGASFDCDWLEQGSPTVLLPGDTLLALPPDASGRGIVLGRIGPYRAPVTPARLTLEATEVLTLKCGDATLDLRADGKAVLKGEDVLIRAKGLQRIKAGSVSIN